MFLPKASIPSLSHIGSDSSCHTTEGVMSTIREAKTVRNEQLDAGMVWEEGRRISKSGSLTKQMTSYTAALSPSQLTLLYPVPTVSAPQWCRKSQDLLCSKRGTRRIINIFFFFPQANSWLCIYGKINTPSSKHGKKQPSVH